MILYRPSDTILLNQSAILPASKQRAHMPRRSFHDGKKLAPNSANDWFNLGKELLVYFCITARQAFSGGNECRASTT
jgi:hypothetical protein